MTPSTSIAGGTPVGGLCKWPYRTYQLHLSFGTERDTVHLVGYQRIGAANPLVGGVTQQASTARQTLALPIQLDESTLSLPIQQQFISMVSTRFASISSF
jgi:hypothetical protein